MHWCAALFGSCPPRAPLSVLNANTRGRGGWALEALLTTAPTGNVTIGTVTQNKQHDWTWFSTPAVLISLWPASQLQSEAAPVSNRQSTAAHPLRGDDAKGMGRGCAGGGKEVGKDGEGMVEDGEGWSRDGGGWQGWTRVGNLNDGKGWGRRAGGTERAALEDEDAVCAGLPHAPHSARHGAGSIANTALGAWLAGCLVGVDDVLVGRTRHADLLRHAEGAASAARRARHRPRHARQPPRVHLPVHRVPHRQ
eukprot:1353770-Rhodomonas_salina.1